MYSLLKYEHNVCLFGNIQLCMSDKNANNI